MIADLTKFDTIKIAVYNSKNKFQGKVEVPCGKYELIYNEIAKINGKRGWWIRVTNIYQEPEYYKYRNGAWFGHMYVIDVVV